MYILQLFFFSTKYKFCSEILPLWSLTSDTLLNKNSWAWINCEYFCQYYYKEPNTLWKISSIFELLPASVHLAIQPAYVRKKRLILLNLRKFWKKEEKNENVREIFYMEWSSFNEQIKIFVLIQIDPRTWCLACKYSKYFNSIKWNQMSIQKSIFS